MSDPDPDIELMLAQAKIAADRDDRQTRKILTFMLVGGLLALVAGLITLAVILGQEPAGVPDWLSTLIPVAVTALIAGAGVAWAYHMGSSSGSRSKDENPAAG